MTILAITVIFISILAVVIAAWLISRQAEKAFQIYLLLSFSRDVRESDQRLADAGDDPCGVLIDRLNLIEIYAAVMNGRLARGVARRVITSTLIDALVTFEVSEPASELFEASATGGSTFEQIRRFRTSHDDAFLGEIGRRTAHPKSAAGTV